MSAAQPRPERHDSAEALASGRVYRMHVVPSPASRTLTANELRVLELMADGRERAEIARILSASDGSFVSIESVKSIEQRVVVKLRARSRPHVVAVGLRSGLIR